MPIVADSPVRGDGTREALLAAAVMVFGRDGFHAASTRAIAEEAGANLALIGYHFGGKQGLYLAVFEWIAERLGAMIQPTAEAVARELGFDGAASASPPSPERCVEGLLRLVDQFIEIMTSEECAVWARLIMLEQQAPSAAFELIFTQFMGRVLAIMTFLVRHALPDESDVEVRLQVATIMGQVLAFRAARAGIERHMGWNGIGPEQRAAIQARVRRNIRAQLNFAPVGPT